jgi:hypothetical protein
MMAAYMAAAQPDEHHARLAEQVGDWTFSMTHWPSASTPWPGCWSHRRIRRA